MIAMYKNFLLTLAQTAYGELPYSGETVNYSGVCVNDSCTVTTSPLANTGFTLWFAITLASLLIFFALLVRFWKRSKIDKN